MTSKETDITIIGAGLTGLTLAYYLSKHGKKVTIIEKNDHIGGVIRTIREEGFTFETGPNTGVLSSAELVELFDDLHDSISVETANSTANSRWIWKDNKWCPLPSSLFTAIITPLFSLYDKFRILGEPFRMPGENKNESVADLVRRRMGDSFLEYAVDPFISGIYSGDPERLITRFALPKLYNLEQDYGSFIKGAIKKRKEPKSDIEKRVSKAVFSINGGLQNLVDTLAEKIGKEKIHLNCNNADISKDGELYNTTFTDKGKSIVNIKSNIIISTIRGNNLHSLFSFIPKNELAPITKAKYAKVVQLIACYKKWDAKPLDAFGGLVPSKEDRQCLGILFPSSIFKDRAPMDGAILSVFMGGIKKPGIIEKTDDEIEQIALSEIRNMLGSSTSPDILKIFRYQNAIPQYEIDTEARYEAITSLEKKHPGLILAGNIRDGIGIADRVKQGKHIALQILNQ